MDSEAMGIEWCSGRREGMAEQQDRRVGHNRSSHGGQEAKSETGRAGLHIFFKSAFEQPKFSPSSPTSKSVIGS